MRKTSKGWSIEELDRRHSMISFPEYQREPTIWSRVAKQRLVDSILRQFDIASLYFYEDKDGSLECIDGRQRIGAIMSFLGKNPDDEDNGFGLKLLNEIYEDADAPFKALEDMGFLEAKKKAKKGEALAKKLVEAFCGYQLTVVLLSKSRRAEEFNLQFTRLNLGTIINSGEKLHAMVGEMRDICFAEVGQHPFLERVSIPTRRYSKEQVAAQILAQAFAIRQTQEYTRTRHFDLQRFFKENTELDPSSRGWVQEIASTLDALAKGFSDPGVLHNRAITVSAVLLAWKLRIRGVEATRYASFIEEFLCRLSWQVGKGLEIDREYQDLLDFQRHVTQASVEKPAVQARAERLEAEYASWLAKKALTGDKKYTARTRKKPSEQCRKAKAPAH